MTQKVAPTDGPALPTKDVQFTNRPAPSDDYTGGKEFLRLFDFNLNFRMFETFPYKDEIFNSRFGSTLSCFDLVQHFIVQLCSDLLYKATR